MTVPSVPRTLLGVYPHPDDEAYSAAGTLALSARLGATVKLICASRGSNGRHRSFPKTTPAELAATRTRELWKSCGTMGAAPPEFLDLPDGAIWRQNPAPVLERLKEALRSFRPDVVVTLGPDGVYGHRDHLACTELVVRAVEDVLPHQRIRVLGAAFPLDLFRPVYRRLTRARGVPVDRRFDSEALGTDRQAADLCVSISLVRDVKLRALACHASQLREGDPYSFLGGGITEKLLEEEWFVRLAGPAFPPGSSGVFDGL